MVERAVLVKAAGLCGIVGPFIVYPLIVAATFYYQGFSWPDNALSDLGVSGVSAALFNPALVIGALLLALFSIGLAFFMDGYAIKMSAALLLCSSFFLAAIGVFPETYGALHFYVSVAFFVLIVLSTLSLGVTLLLHKQVFPGVLTVLGALAAALIWLYPWRGVAIPEALASIILSIRVVSLGVKMLGKRSSAT